MKNFGVIEFKEIFKNVITNNDDYADKSKVKKHNVAMTKLSKEIEDVSKDKDLLINLFGLLLNDENSFIKRYISAECLKYEVLQDKAVSVLKMLLKDDKHKFNAEIILKQYKKL